MFTLKPLVRYNSVCYILNPLVLNLPMCSPNRVFSCDVTVTRGTRSLAGVRVDCGVQVDCKVWHMHTAKLSWLFEPSLVTSIVVHSHEMQLVTIHLLQL